MVIHGEMRQILCDVAPCLRGTARFFCDNWDGKDSYSDFRFVFRDGEVLLAQYDESTSTWTEPETVTTDDDWVYDFHWIF